MLKNCSAYREQTFCVDPLTNYEMRYNFILVFTTPLQNRKF
ncbi:hypothetical protein Calab_2985 [Caldithrix abyssi DSM 13497]|uniref:Uncharacterized protein n=1 Tax=Caldithrix abyssi DSM 13497 TaxID=880073 RepID=H1XSP4_CALAY|nr:hypothetical protein Calab_2985 [Caldithrix abyssi DSM 13497]